MLRFFHNSNRPSPARILSVWIDKGFLSPTVLASILLKEYIGQPGVENLITKGIMNVQKLIKKSCGIRNQAGFTLIEIMASLVIIGVISTVGIRKFDQISDSASQRALDYAYRELNSRELLTWGLIKISDVGWQSDEALFSQLDIRLGEGYGWSSGPAITGGTLRMQSASLPMNRIPSTISMSGKWDIK
jgi:prepilin-type N-terminal cleavage/methylation domain-containing protein